MSKKKVWKICFIAVCFIWLGFALSSETKAFEEKEVMDFERTGGSGIFAVGEAEKKKEEAAWKENSEIMNTLITSGKKSGVQAIADKYKISKKEAKEKFQASMKYFNEKGKKEEAKDNMLWYPETGLKITKGAGTAATMILGVVAPGIAAVESKSLAVIVGGSSLAATAYVSASMKITSLAFEYGAYALGKEPPWNEINKFNEVSDHLNTVGLIGGAAVSAPKTVAEVLGTIVSAAADSGVGKAYKAAKAYVTGEEDEPPLQDLSNLGKVWHEVEGGIKGIWTRRGDSNIFDANWKNGAVGVLTMHLDGNKVVIDRTDPRGVSKGLIVKYEGTISADGKSVSGIETVPWGTLTWSATIDSY